MDLVSTDMEKISLNAFLPVEVKKVLTGSELLLAHELDKYSRKLLNKRVTLEGIPIAKELIPLEFFSYVVAKDLDVGFEPDKTMLCNYTHMTRVFFEGTTENLVFVSDTPEMVHYRFEHDIRKNDIMYREDKSTAYVSLVAYLMVRAYVDGLPTPKLYIDHSKHAQSELEYVNLLILQDYGNKILAGLLKIDFNEDWGYQPPWESYLMYHRQLGHMAREYTVPEKYRTIKKHFNIGDVVLLYHRTKGAKGKSINLLLTCYPAIIRDYTQTHIKLEYFPDPKTRLTHVNDLQAVVDLFESEGKQPIHTPEDFARFTKAMETFPLTSIGVHTSTYVETQFIVPVVESSGGYQYFKTPEGMDYVWLPTPDMIYAFFEDRQIEYNKLAFMEAYFTSKGKTPMYEQYKKRKEDYERNRLNIPEGQELPPDLRF